MAFTFYVRDFEAPCCFSVKFLYCPSTVVHSVSVFQIAYNIDEIHSSTDDTSKLDRMNSTGRYANLKNHFFEIATYNEISLRMENIPYSTRSRAALDNARYIWQNAILLHSVKYVLEQYLSSCFFISCFSLACHCSFHHFSTLLLE